jgi:hypothetical protein
MGRLVLNIPDELEMKYREAVYKRYGMKKREHNEGNSRGTRDVVMAVNRKGVEANRALIGQD